MIIIEAQSENHAEQHVQHEQHASSALNCHIHMECRLIFNINRFINLWSRLRPSFKLVKNDL